MQEIKPLQPLVPSVLDRLIDFEPDVRSEAPRSRNQLVRELKNAVRRDLENLLNTRIRCVPPPPELIELKQSLVSYGLPDLTGVSLGGPSGSEEFRRTIHNCISRFECRLTKLSVRLLNESQQIERTIHFQIDAVLQAEPAPEPIQFDSVLRVTTGTFDVKGEPNG
jgi:type VI secretion system protein ImpF